MVNQDEEDRKDEEKSDLPWTKEECTARMLQVNGFIKDVSNFFSDIQRGSFPVNPQTR